MNRTNTTPQLRRAALAVHALQADDQQWMLKSLGADAVKDLTPLLAELRSIGFVPDARMATEFQQLLGNKEDAAAVPPSAHEAIERLTHADPTRLASLLKNEPPLLIATFVGLKNWPWRQEFLLQFSPQIRLRVESHARNQERVPKEQGGMPTLHRELLTRLAARYEQAVALQSGPAGSGNRNARSPNAVPGRWKSVQMSWDRAWPELVGTKLKSDRRSP